MAELLGAREGCAYATTWKSRAGMVLEQGLTYRRERASDFPRATFFTLGKMERSARSTALSRSNAVDSMEKFLSKILMLTDLVNYGKIHIMKLSTKSEYGLRAMLNIAMNDAGNTTSITEANVKFLEMLTEQERGELRRIIKKLRTAVTQ